MSETIHNFGENDPLGPCEIFADVIRRQGRRFEIEGKNGRAALAALPGIENEQNVRRWGPVKNDIGGELPRLRTIVDGLPHWPRAMQIDTLVVTFRGTRLAISIGPAEAAAGVTSSTLTHDAMLIGEQAAGLVRQCYAAEQDNLISGEEATNIQAVGDALRGRVTQFLGRVITAATSRPLRRNGTSAG